MVILTDRLPRVANLEPELSDVAALAYSFSSRRSRYTHGLLFFAELL